MTSHDTHQETHETHDLDSRTRELAYELWEQAGKPDRQDLEFWERAKRILSSAARPDALSRTASDVLTA